MDPLLLLVLGIPIGILIGLGASVIGLTAWPLIVPLFFVFGGFSLHESLLASMCIDLVLATFLAIFYKQKTKIEIEINYGLKLGAISGAVAFIAAAIAFPLLLQFPDAFKGGSGIINLILGALFIIQAVRTKNGPNALTPTPLEVQPPAKRERWHQNLTEKQRGLFVFVFCAFQGLITGIIAIGGAMNIVIILIILLGYPTLRAVGTAMISTSIMLSITVMVYLILLEFVVTIWFWIFFYSLIAILSCVIGVRIAQRISERSLRFVIGIVVITAAIFSFIQAFLLT